jgi:large conductance mechanosensitive channel
MGVLREFRTFIMRGNVVDLAVGVVAGVAFGAVINSLVNDVILPLIAAIFGEPNFDNLTFSISNGVIRYGEFLTALTSFLLVMAGVFFLVVKPMNVVSQRLGIAEEDANTRECPFCLEPVPSAATRCKACTSQLSAT